MAKSQALTILTKGIFTNLWLELFKTCLKVALRLEVLQLKLPPPPSTSACPTLSWTFRDTVDPSHAYQSPFGHWAVTLGCRGMGQEVGFLHASLVVWVN